MNLNSPIPVRFGQDTSDRLKAVSESSGIPVAQLIRLATERYLTEIESGNSITIQLKKKPGKPKSGK